MKRKRPQKAQKSPKARCSCVSSAFLWPFLSLFSKTRRIQIEFIRRNDIDVSKSLELTFKLIDLPNQNHCCPLAGDLFLCDAQNVGGHDIGEAVSERFQVIISKIVQKDRGETIGQAVWDFNTQGKAANKIRLRVLKLFGRYLGRLKFLQLLEHEIQRFACFCCA